jgi:hypothetical protein
MIPTFRRPLTSAVAVFAAVAGAACHGHLDFGIATGTGGLVATGGITGTGGLVATGGATGTGGLVATGGATGTGGLVATGGATGTGGLVATGGSGGNGGRGPGGGGGTDSCVAEGDCPLSLHCDLAGAKTCVPCVNDAHCPAAGLPRCNTALHRCVACLLGSGGQDCTAAQSCVANRCMTKCTEEPPSGCPGGSSCDNGLCISCADDGVACSGTPMTPYCLDPPKICVGCRSTSDCTNSSPARPLCDPARNVCVECNRGADCPTGKPFCDPRTGTCSAG